MAVRIENAAVEDFGTWAVGATATHARLQVGNAVLTTRPLANARTIVAGGSARFSIGEIDLVCPAGEFENPGWNAFLALALNGTNALTTKLMTSSTVEVSVSGYADQDVTDWDLSNESD